MRPALAPKAVEVLVVGHDAAVAEVAEDEVVEAEVVGDAPGKWYLDIIESTNTWGHNSLNKVHGWEVRGDKFDGVSDR